MIRHTKWLWRGDGDKLLRDNNFYMP